MYIYTQVKILEYTDLLCVQPGIQCDFNSHHISKQSPLDNTQKIFHKSKQTSLFALTASIYSVNMARYKSANNHNRNNDIANNDVNINRDIGPIRRLRRGRPSNSSTDRRRKPEDEIRRESRIDNLRHQHTFEKDRFYVVEKILAKRPDDKGNMEYLVRWQNYPPQWDTWEPFDELKNNCIDMINEFNGIIDPNRSTREDLSHCICKEPYRFDSGGMIQCYQCNTWFHFRCLKMNMEQANAYARYFCEPCLAKNPQFKNLIKSDRQYLFPQQQDE